MEKLFVVVCYRRIGAEPERALSWERALSERAFRQGLHPENLYVIEDVKP